MDDFISMPATVGRFLNGPKTPLHWRSAGNGRRDRLDLRKDGCPAGNSGGNSRKMAATLALLNVLKRDESN